MFREADKSLYSALTDIRLSFGAERIWRIVCEDYSLQSYSFNEFFIFTPSMYKM